MVRVISISQEKILTYLLALCLCLGISLVNQTLLRAEEGAMMSPDGGYMPYADPAAIDDYFDEWEEPLPPVYEEDFNMEPVPAETAGVDEALNENEVGGSADGIFVEQSTPGTQNNQEGGTSEDAQEPLWNDEEETSDSAVEGAVTGVDEPVLAPETADSGSDPIEQGFLIVEEDPSVEEPTLDDDPFEEYPDGSIDDWFDEGILVA